MSKASDAGKAFLAGVLQKVPEALRAQVETALTDPTAEDALVVLGTGALAQSDINKKYDDIKAKEDALTEDYTKLNTWYGERKADLDELAKLKANGGNGNGNPKPPADPNPPMLDPSKYLDRETFAKTMQQEQMAAANYLGLQNVLTLSHYKDFGEILDTRDLLADKRLGTARADGGTFGLKDAYEAKFADKLSEKRQKEEDARINKIADDRVAERMKGLSAAPFPLKGAPSPLDVLEQGSSFKPEDYTAEAAAAEYARLQAARAT